MSCNEGRGRTRNSDLDIGSDVFDCSASLRLVWWTTSYLPREPVFLFVKFLDWGQSYNGVINVVVQALLVLVDFSLELDFFFNCIFDWDMLLGIWRCVWLLLIYYDHLILLLNFLRHYAPQGNSKEDRVPVFYSLKVFRHAYSARCLV